jgi:hypothetical protein
MGRFGLDPGNDCGALEHFMHGRGLAEPETSASALTDQLNAFAQRMLTRLNLGL